MPRYPTKSALPPLVELLPEFVALDARSPKLKQVAEWLRTVIASHRTTKNLPFYSTRDLAKFFKVSQNTAALAVKILESEGLLRRVRGSQTLLQGTKVITRTKIRAVAGLMLWIFAQRFSEPHSNLTANLAESLWPHNIVVDIIPHYDIGDVRPDLNERLKIHGLDFAIWPFPFPHHRDHMLHLQDRGIRNLIISEHRSGFPVTPQIHIDYGPAYRELLAYWRADHKIEKVIVVEPAEFTPRQRLSTFVQIAQEMGFNCTLEKSSPDLPAAILARERKKIGIALLDEHSMVEFTFYDPSTFVKILRKHRLLYGNGPLNVPFVPDGELRFDRIFVPMPKESRDPTKSLYPAIEETLVEWCSGNFQSAPRVIKPVLWRNTELWRYL
jgi:DNA-binding transcriptional regulator YhcF (GntR family)